MTGFTLHIDSPRNYIPGRPGRSPVYRRFVRRHRCCACFARWGIDCAHTGPHGLNEKASDFDTIPLCHKRCHPEYDANPAGFLRKHYHVDIPAVVGRLHREFDSLRRQL